MTNSMLGTSPQDKFHKHLHISNACEPSRIMIILVGSKMSKAENDLKAIMHPAYDTIAYVYIKNHMTIYSFMYVR